MPLVSVIIPNYNNAHWLSSCLESCLNQQGNFRKEIVVVDDHSTDDSWAILQQYKENYPNDIFIYRNKEKGGNQARNFGFLKSTGDYIQWLDSDDVLLPNKFIKQLQAFSKNERVDVVYSDWRMDFYNTDKDMVQQQLVQRKPDDDFLFTLLVNKDWNASHAYLCRRCVCEAMDTIEGWSEITKIGQDREYFTQLAINGAKFVYEPGTFAVYHRWSAQTVSNKFSSFEVCKESLRLNHLFFQRIKKLELDNGYCRILNSELLKIIFYNPKIVLPRFFYPWEVNLNTIHWKTRFIAPMLYLKILVKKLLKK
jgi:glycosyltransferase involved in cell wall biosynthesis